MKGSKELSREDILNLILEYKDKKNQNQYDSITQMLIRLNSTNKEINIKNIIVFIEIAKKELLEDMITSRTVFSLIRNKCKSHAKESQEIELFLNNFLYKKRLDYLKNKETTKYELILKYGEVYKIKKNIEGKDILYPGDMPDEIIDEIEKIVRNKYFVSITYGDAATGKSWGETYDRKGKISYTSGHDYKFPIFIGFKRGNEEYDEIDYDFLNEKPIAYIAEYLENNDLNFMDVLDSGGTTLSNSIVMIKGGKNLNKLKKIYKHENFEPLIDWNKIKIKLNEIEVSTVITEKHNMGSVELSNVVNETKEVKKEYVVMSKGKDGIYTVFSKHSDFQELKDYVNSQRENEDFRVMKDEWFNKKLEESKKNPIEDYTRIMK